jgi:hypothetical protein
MAALGLLVVSAAQAAPLVIQKPVAAQSGVIDVREGCGPGWHRESWRNRYGEWRTRCVPNHHHY